MGPHMPVALRLVRAVVVSIGDPPLAELDNMHLGFGDVVVESGRPVRLDGRHIGHIVVATAPTQLPDLDMETFEISLDARRSAEGAIEALASLVALEHRTGHSISSPAPYIGYTSEDQAVLDKLNGKRTDQAMVSGVGPLAGGVAGLLEEDIVAGISDRSDGLALLAAALCHQNALGRFHELMRLFERAFARKAGRLSELLVPFLTDPAGPHGFTKREIHVWVEARPKVSHADRRLEFLLESDVRLWVGRMLDAGYDVLLNKANWREPSTTRRSLWRPTSGSLNSQSGVFLTKGRDASLTVQLLDGFGAYPLLLGGPIDEILPTGVWLEGDVNGGRLRRIDTGSVA